MRWLMCGLAILLSGCHAAQALDVARVPNEPAFRDMWARYSDCRSSTGVLETWQDAEHLNRAVRLIDESRRATHILPQVFEQALAPPPPRLAVDPRAMAAACTLSAGHVAHHAGQDWLAAKLFQFVLLNFEESRYSYYREQAFKGIVRLGNFASEQILRVPTRQIP
ncbi:MAG: hypothetical protein P0111_00090 [Nitrospira sp.]|nr:hypothetical protein [Nitrospira sp.]